MSSATRRSSRVHEIVRGFHERSDDADASLLQATLHIRPGDNERLTDLPQLLHRFGNQNFDFAGTSFAEIREIFHAVRPRAGQIFCDAGAGYGHVVFYGAYVMPCRFRAIEILPGRCAAMRRSARRLGLRTVEIVQGDALAEDYGDISYLFLNNPFFLDPSRHFLNKLASPRKRALTVIAINNIVAALREDSGFVEIASGADIPNYRFGLFRLAKR